MITIISSPKPFVKEDKTNQYNAIANWLQLANVEVILFGEEEGISEAGNHFGVNVIKDVDCSSEGIPLFNSIIQYSENIAKYDIIMYINCDILLNNSILEAVKAIEFNKFLLIGERLDLQPNEFINLFDQNHKTLIRSYLQKGKLKIHGPTGVDYFVFRKGIWNGLPPTIIGRGGYDSALIAHCKRRNIKIVDGTGFVTALHQFHDYSHINGGITNVFHGADAKINNKAQGGRFSSNVVSDAEYIIENKTIKEFNCRGDKLRGIEIALRYKYNSNILAFLVRVVRRLFNLGPLVPPNAYSRILNGLK